MSIYEYNGENSFYEEDADYKERLALREDGFEIETDSRTELPSLGQKFTSLAGRSPLGTATLLYSPMLCTALLARAMEAQENPVFITTFIFAAMSPVMASGTKSFNALMDSLTFKDIRLSYKAAHLDRVANRAERDQNRGKADAIRKKADAIKEKIDFDNTICMPYADKIVPIPKKHIFGQYQQRENEYRRRKDFNATLSRDVANDLVKDSHGHYRTVFLLNAKGSNLPRALNMMREFSKDHGDPDICLMQTNEELPKSVHVKVGYAQSFERQFNYSFN